MNKNTRVLLIVLWVLVGVSGVLMAEDQYEYMVVSLGKNLFIKDYGKTYAYYDEMPASDHALLTEMQLDILGKHSWEVIDMLGTIGGDQQITLKRVYDEARSKEELKAIEENQTKAQSNKSKAPVLEAPKKEKPTLIDLDAKEAAEKEARRRAQLELNITQSVTKILNKEMFEDISFTWDEKGYNPKQYFIESINVNFEVTQKYLLERNTYRKTQVESYLQEELQKVVVVLSNLGVKPNWLRLHAFITYEGQRFNVGSAAKFYLL